MFVTIGPPSWTPPHIAVQVHQLRQRLGISKEPRLPSAPTIQNRALAPPPATAQVIQPQTQTPPAHVVRRCAVNGVVVEMLNGNCPPSAPLAPPLPTVSRTPEVRENPFFKPGTIYKCKSYSGGSFWAQSHCSQHNALIERIASVPIGMPFQQQVDVADGELHRVESQLRGEQREDARRVTCQMLRGERERIWKRSGTGTGYVPLDVLGADQTRWRQIESQLSQNNCGR
ncbi:MAG: hypothetical protein V4792_05240 [Pseudomonadota bacterium]